MPRHSKWHASALDVCGGGGGGGFVENYFHFSFGI